MAVSGEALVPIYFPGTGKSYDRVVRWTTLGQDGRWKRRLLSMVPPSKSILELACGTGILTFRLLARNPGARLTGVDITDDYLQVARAKHAQLGGDVEFRLGDAVTVPVADRGPFDAVVSCYIPKYVDLDRLVAHLTPTVVPGGVLVLHDFTRPRGFVPRVLWRAWFGILNTIAPLMHPEWRQVFDASLTELIRTTKWVRHLREALARHGWTEITTTRMTGGSATLVSAKRPKA
jgi:demethylmenaquinone methyltransferase/2-methoxy-6-polyprenyl-1,4-benzoquinol methylase